MRRLPATSEPRPVWWTQVLLVVGFAVGYDEVRALHGDVVRQGLSHGRDMLRIDAAMHMSWAHPVNAWVTEHHVLAEALSYYYFVMHLGMTALVLLVLWLRGDGYRWHRNALFGSSLIALGIYWLYPVAPPRMLGGFHDTVRDAVPAAYHLEAANANLYAAVPSLHMAWALWCAVALWTLSSLRLLRAVAVVHVLVTSVTILATGNHYVFDLVSGVLLVCVTYPLLRSTGAVRARVAAAGDGLAFE